MILASVSFLFNKTFKALCTTVSSFRAASNARLASSIFTWAKSLPALSIIPAASNFKAFS